MDADGSNQARLTRTDNEAPVWSPDGQHIAFMGLRPNFNQIVVMDPDGTDQNQLTTEPEGAKYPEWSPDGTTILFTGGASPTRLYAMDADGGNKRLVTDAQVVSPAWQPVPRSDPPPMQPPPPGDSGPVASPPPATPPPAVDRPKKRTRVVAKAKKRRNVLRVRIRPDLGPTKQWKFTVKKKRKSGSWRALKKRKGGVKVYRTKGRKHVRVLNLPKGRYKVRSRPARGYGADTSRVVRLKR